MTTIKGERLITINADAGETYAVDYGTTYTVSIFNHTDDIVTLSAKENYPDDGTASACIKIGAGTFCNGFNFPGQYLYLTASSNGDISIIKAA